MTDDEPPPPPRSPVPTLYWGILAIALILAFVLAIRLIIHEPPF